MITAPTTFYVRGMICSRCILLVERLVRRLGLTPVHVELGEVRIMEETTAIPWAALTDELAALGFALLQPLTRRLAHQLEALVADLLRTAPQQIRANGVSRLAELLGCRLPQLRAVCRVELGTDLPRYLARRRVESVQALLISRPRMPIRDVARRLGYSSQAHLCRQFRSITGLPPTVWRRSVPR